MSPRVWDRVPPGRQSRADHAGHPRAVHPVRQHREPLQLRHRHPDLHAARARAERRRRLRRTARSRLRRVLRLRRLHLRLALGHASEKGHVYTIHWSAEVAIPVAVVVCGVLGVFLGSPSRRLPRRLPRDRHALLRAGLRRLHRTATRSVRASRPRLATGSPNVDPRGSTLFGLMPHDHLGAGATTTFAFGSSSCSSLIVALPRRSSHAPVARGSRSREDPLAAELMGMPGQPAEAHRLRLRARRSPGCAGPRSPAQHGRLPAELRRPDADHRSTRC